MKINKGSTLTPSEYFGLDPNSKYSELFNHIYKLTQVRQFETEIEEGEIDEEVPVESEFQDTQEEHLAYQSTAEDLSCRKIQTQSNEKQPEERQFIPSSLRCGYSSKNTYFSKQNNFSSGFGGEGGLRE